MQMNKQQQDVTQKIWLIFKPYNYGPLPAFSKFDVTVLNSALGVEGLRFLVTVVIENPDQCPTTVDIVSAAIELGLDLVDFHASHKPSKGQAFQYIFQLAKAGKPEEYADQMVAKGPIKKPIGYLHAALTEYESHPVTADMFKKMTANQIDTFFALLEEKIIAMAHPSGNAFGPVIKILDVAPSKTLGCHLVGYLLSALPGGIEKNCGASITMATFDDILSQARGLGPLYESVVLGGQMLTSTVKKFSSLKKIFPGWIVYFSGPGFVSRTKLSSVQVPVGVALSCKDLGTSFVVEVQMSNANELAQGMKEESPGWSIIKTNTTVFKYELSGPIGPEGRFHSEGDMYIHITDNIKAGHKNIEFHAAGQVNFDYTGKISNDCSIQVDVATLPDGLKRYSLVERSLGGTNILVVKQNGSVVHEKQGHPVESKIWPSGTYVTRKSDLSVALIVNGIEALTIDQNGDITAHGKMFVTTDGGKEAIEHLAKQFWSFIAHNNPLNNKVTKLDEELAFARSHLKDTLTYNNALQERYDKLYQETRGVYDDRGNMDHRTARFLNVADNVENDPQPLE